MEHYDSTKKKKKNQVALTRPLVNNNVNCSLLLKCSESDDTEGTLSPFVQGIMNTDSPDSKINSPQANGRPIFQALPLSS
jgi:hypothetical protein